MKTIKDRLIELKKDYPALTFQNEGYKYLSKEVKEKYKDQIDEISEIMKKLDPRFTEFNNFKDRNDGSFAIRYQAYYDSSHSFIGVVYLNINEIE